jgi:hypothetical protein
MRKAVYAAILLATVAGSFLLTLRLLNPGAPPTAQGDQSYAARLASYTISDRADLIEAAVGIGLHGSARLRARVDEISRTNESEVSIAGWLADPGAEGEPLDVLVFVSGKKGEMTKTKGERPDVTKALRLGFGAEKNVAFRMNVRCHKGDQLLIAGIGTDKQYLHISSPLCP